MTQINMIKVKFEGNISEVYDSMQFNRFCWIDLWRISLISDVVYQMYDVEKKYSTDITVSSFFHLHLLLSVCV